MRLIPLLAERLPTQSAPPTDLVEWTRWRAEESAGLADPAIAEAAGRVAGGVSRADDESLLRRAGAYAVAPLMPFVLKADGAQAERASVLAARITRKPWAVTADMAPEVKAETYERWRRWWRYDYVRYSAFSWPRRLARHFTHTQYGIWFGKIVTFDFDVSYTKHRPVLDLIKERLPVSVQLSLISIFIAYLVAIPLGVYSSIRQYSLSDRVITIVLFVLYSLPSFWVGNMLILYLTGPPYLSWFPSTRLHTPGLDPWTWVWLKDWVWHLALPIGCLTYASFAREHVGDRAPGLHPHRARQGPDRTRRHRQTRPAQFAHPDPDPVGRIAARVARRLGHHRADFHD
jgi:hypothetical protein